MCTACKQHEKSLASGAEVLAAQCKRFSTRFLVMEHEAFQQITMMYVLPE